MSCYVHRSRGSPQINISFIDPSSHANLNVDNENFSKNKKKHTTVRRAHTDEAERKQTRKQK